MILDTRLETRLYTNESAELPAILKNRFPRIQFVYQPENHLNLKDIFSYSQKNKISIVPRGAATSGIGCILPLKRSIMVDLTHLNQILDFDEKKKTIYFEAGLRWWELKRFLKKHSLDLYTYPTSLFSTVGGWLATGGYGINSFRFGHISNLVDSIEIIQPNNAKSVGGKDREFKYFIGTEGQMGIISKVRLRVREAKLAKSNLIFFKNSSEAVEFLFELLKSPKILPIHISYFDRNRLGQKNLLLKGKVSFPELEGVLLAFEGLSSKAALLSLVERKKGILAEDYLTAFLWNERFFPFSVKHFYPSLLGCEIILPIENLNHYLTRVRNFGENYGLPLSTEVTLINKKEAVVFTIFPSDPRKFIGFFHLLLTYSLTHIALGCGGKPYGIGVWNLPLLKKKFSKEEINEYRSFKKEFDPLNLLNPSKSFSPDYMITNFLKLGYLISGLLSHNYPFLKPFSKALNHNHWKEKRSLPESDACANCGACMAVCPSYLMNRTEAVAAKGKLFLLKQLVKGSPLPEVLAEKVFLCLHCHLCEYVCQSKLTLVPVWEKLELALEKTLGRPKEKIEDFVKQVEANPAYGELLDSFNIVSDNNYR